MAGTARGDVCDALKAVVAVMEAALRQSRGPEARIIVESAQREGPDTASALLVLAVEGGGVRGVVATLSLRGGLDAFGSASLPTARGSVCEVAVLRALSQTYDLEEARVPPGVAEQDMQGWAERDVKQRLIEAGDEDLLAVKCFYARMD